MTFDSTFPEFPEFKEARCLVTGGAGFIGSHIVDRLLASGAHVTVLDNFSTGSRANLVAAHHAGPDRLEVIDGTITHWETVFPLVEKSHYVFHLGARPSVTLSIQAPSQSHEANIQGTFVMLEAARLCHERKTGLRRFVNTSSSSVYGNTPQLPKSEEMAGNTLSPYALQKWTGENYARLYHSLYGLPTVSIRPFNVFGPRQDPKSQYSAAIPRFIAAAFAHQALTIFGDGEQTRDFTHVDNVVQAFLRAATVENPRALGQSYNAGAGGRFSVNLLAQTVVALAGSSSRIEHLAPRAGDIRDSFADLRRANADLGYHPLVSFESGLKDLVEWSRTEVPTKEMQ